MLGVALNEVFVPILQKQFPEIVDFYLPPEGCSYRLAVISIKKAYPGHAKRVMFGLWSFLRQFMYTKFIIVTDDDVDVRDWKEVIWAVTTRMDPVRDTTLVEHTPIDYLDFASPVSGLGGKVGLDATNKWPGETSREWGRPITMDAAGVVARVDAGAAAACAVGPADFRRPATAACHGRRQSGRLPPRRQTHGARTPPGRRPATPVHRTQAGRRWSAGR